MARALGGVRGRTLLLAALAIIGSVAVATCLQAAGAAPRPPEDPTERLLLRLHDLPPGYFPLDLSEGAGREFECEAIEPAHPGPRLAAFVERFAPKGCLGIYLRAYRLPALGPSAVVVGTGALDAGSLEAAEAGFEVAPQMLAALTEDGAPEEVASATTVGDATRLFHWRHAPRYYRNGHLGSFLVWRSGDVLAAVFASAGSLEASDWIVAELAQRQQAHVEGPTPYTRADRDTTELLLDDPSLTFPVYWLGRSFDPGHGLPAARLRAGSASRRGDGLPWQKLEVAYSRNLYLDSWTSAGWKRFLATPRARELRTWHCTESTEFALPRGSATIFAGYRRDFDTCPSRPPDRYFAFVHVGGTVTAVNFVGCSECIFRASGPYNSLRGMKAVVRGLHLRPRRIY